jgi:exodeoxyribonuclease V alpha subunit
MAWLRTKAPLRPAESLSGLIERVTFHNDENGFAVLQIKARGHRDLVTAIGSLASVSPGADYVPREKANSYQYQ